MIEAVLVLCVLNDDGEIVFQLNGNRMSLTAVFLDGDGKQQMWDEQALERGEYPLLLVGIGITPRHI